MSAATTPSNLQVEISNRQILKIALPITLALLVPQINFLTNNVFLGWLGETELGAAGITGVYYLVMALIGNGLSSGMQAIISRRAGENRIEEIGATFSQTIRIALLFAAATIILTYLIAPPLLSSVLQSTQVEKEAISFIKIRIWGIPFLYLFQLGNGFLIGTNNSRYLKYAFMTEALLNILLDYVLIFGKWGFPTLGFDGAAYASVAAEIVAVIILAIVIFYKKFDAQFFLLNRIRYNVALTKLILKQSVPLILQWGISILAWLYFYILIENTGERPLAISNTMRNIFGLVGIFCWAFASTTNTMVSNIIGQGKKDKVIFLVKKIRLLSFSFTTLLCLLINLFPQLFLLVYDQQPDFIVAAVPVIRMVSVGILCMSIATVWLNAVTGTGNSKMNLFIEIVAIIIYCFYIYLVINVWQLSLVWAWSSELLYWGILLILSFLYMKSGKWKKKTF
ncbi:MAG: MATE family efflux transporter [Chitinophagaceae bacterium]|nr:MAG: MATE family efflux transporter [Chitinophagaceae bacterium]